VENGETCSDISYATWTATDVHADSDLRIPLRPPAVVNVRRVYVNDYYRLGDNNVFFIFGADVFRAKNARACFTR